ncbi:MAG: tRNA (guanosine(37)-N1)-methyltransferase TrmD [Hyphomonadaceae bacterium]|nr:tRNA (guanosine(37)-N1)-methyltransferase TrmD [Hyphomonadaceae bacterium]MBC6412854.1 tRNA (guanosine(37)-N1)-methyltransferase TrmD [Hyphomonadaceae bacterium]
MSNVIDSSPWTATVLTLFPEAFAGVLDTSVIGTAKKNHIWALETVDIRKFADNRRRNVDGTPAGGGPGMVLRADIAARAVDSVIDDHRPLIYLTPRGMPLTQKRVSELAAGQGAVLVCGRFEGLDQRVIDARQMEEISIGDFVLAGGEVAAQALIEACVRLLPGVLGATESTAEESFENGLLEYPLYTQPREWEGRRIPEVLLVGNHGRVADWRRARQIEITKSRRPELYEAWLANGGDHECD